MTEYKLRLYVTKNTTLSQCAIDNLHSICEVELGGLCEAEVIDVLERPELAAGDHILATPTLMRLLPLPTRKIIGDLSDREGVSTCLGLGSSGGRSSERAVSPSTLPRS